MRSNFRIKPVIAGLLTYVPPLQRLIHRKGTGGTNSASYCYGVWMKHLVMLWEQGMRTIPDTVAELGPGDLQPGSRPLRSDYRISCRKTPITQMKPPLKIRVRMNGTPSQ